MATPSSPNPWIFLPRLEHLRTDAPAGLVVFLVALPLCLGVALASGAPLFSGVLAGVVGGLVVSLFSGSELSVSGPAAGLAVIVLGAIQELGSFPAFTVAVLLSGLIQLGLSALRAGIIGDFIPNMVLKGMLAGIGIVIILKQIPHALGDDQDYVGGITFSQGDELNPLSEVANAVAGLSPGAILISALSLAVIFAWERPALKRMRWTGLVPAPLVCVILGTLLNEAFKTVQPGWVLTAAKHHLVELPVVESLADVGALFPRPDFSRVTDVQVWRVAFTIAVVGSLESLISLEAIDKLDPQRRISAPNTELRAQGIGNFVSGLLGGLPVTSVIVRSSANVYAGAQSRLSGMVHGLLLLLAVAVASTVLNRVPLACLAAILLSVGYKLSSLKIIKAVWREGHAQFLPFIITVLGIVFTDLLKGIVIGLAVSVFFVMKSDTRGAVTLVKDGQQLLLRLNKDVTFLNKEDLKERLREVPDGAHFIIDGTRAHHVDHDALETLREFVASAPFRGITIEIHDVLGKNEL